jgi:hypothetical protein
LPVWCFRISSYRSSFSFQGFPGLPWPRCFSPLIWVFLISCSGIWLIIPPGTLVVGRIFTWFNDRFLLSFVVRYLCCRVLAAAKVGLFIGQFLYSFDQYFRIIFLWFCSHFCNTKPLHLVFVPSLWWFWFAIRGWNSWWWDWMPAPLGCWFPTAWWGWPPVSARPSSSAPQFSLRWPAAASSGRLSVGTIGLVWEPPHIPPPYFHCSFWGSQRWSLNFPSFWWGWFFRYCYFWSSCFTAHCFRRAPTDSFDSSCFGFCHGLGSAPYRPILWAKSWVAICWGWLRGNSVIFTIMTESLSCECWVVLTMLFFLFILIHCFWFIDPFPCLHP